ncbi:MAG: CHAP domain-containing protein [Alphaproteobacteria bacterium]|nr:CHAP domain-containing protein [Alphaproteobacteria bacterium]
MEILCRRPGLVLALTGMLAACAGAETQVRQETRPAGLQPASAALRPYPDPGGFLHCVPFARTVSGIEIYGDAWTWWEQARGRYQRGRVPEVGAVLTLKPTQRMRQGHVAVVVSVQDSRRILVSHANWGGDGSTRGKIHSRQPVIDVSPGNDWSEVRLLNTLGSFGARYPVHGFIYQRPDHPSS